MAGAAPYWGRREDTPGGFCGRGGSGAGRSEAGQRHAAEELGAAAGHPAEPRSFLRQLPGAHPPQPRPPGPGVLPPHTGATCTWAPQGPRAPSCWRPRDGQRGASRGSSIRWCTSKSTPYCLAVSHTCRASTSARPLQRANSVGRGCRRGSRRGSAPSPSCASRAVLGAHLDGALQLALKLGAGGPRKGLLEDDHVVDDALLHLLRPQLQVGVARKAHAHPLGPVVLEVAGLPQHLHVHLAHQRALMGVLCGHEFSPLGIGLNVQPECKLHCEVRLLFLSVGKKSGPMNTRVFLVVAVAVILLFKNAKTPGAFLRHQVGGQGLRGGGLGGCLPGHRVEI